MQCVDLPLRITRSIQQEYLDGSWKIYNCGAKIAIRVKALVSSTSNLDNETFPCAGSFELCVSTGASM